MRRNKKRFNFKIMLLVLFGIAVAAILFLAIKIKSFYTGIYTPGNGMAQATLPPEKSVFNILMLGYGGGKHDGTYLTDSMMLLRVDTKNNKAVLFSIPRDIWVKVPTNSGKDFHIKINAIYQMGLFPKDFPDVSSQYSGDGKLLKYVIQNVTGVPIDNYIAVDFEGFTKAIDILGGIDVNVAKTFDDNEYPIDGKENDLCGKDDQFKQIQKYLEAPTLAPNAQADRDKLFTEHPDLKQFMDDISDNPPAAFPCRYEHLHFDAGLQHMNGTTALKYVRSRHGIQDGGDFGRAARQQRFLTAVKEKVLNVTFIPKIVPLLDELKQHIAMDVSVEEIQKFLGEAKDAGTYHLTNYVLSDQNYLKNARSADGQYILVPDEGMDQWDSVHQGVQNVIDGITPSPTPSLTPLPTRAPRILSPTQTISPKSTQ